MIKGLAKVQSHSLAFICVTRVDMSRFALLALLALFAGTIAGTYAGGEFRSYQTDYLNGRTALGIVVISQLGVTCHQRTLPQKASFQGISRR